MSKVQELSCNTRKRSGSGAINSLRREGLIPAVIYGKGVDNRNVRLSRKAVETVLHHSASEHILVNLTVDEAAPAQLALIQDVQHNPLSGQIIHIDFHAIKENEIIHASIPLELVGDAAGVKAGGLLEHLIYSLAVRCLPRDLPEVIQVDVTALELGKSLHVHEIVMPTGVKSSIAGDIMVAMISEPKVAAEVPAAAAPAAKGAAAKGAPAKPAAAAAKAPAAKKK